MKIDFKENKGVTIIALVVTIVVLLIVIGITIEEILEEDQDLIAKTESIKEKDEIAQVKEQVRMDIAKENIWALEEDGNTTLSAEEIRKIIKGKSYIKEIKGDVIITKNGYELPIADIYNDLVATVGEKVTGSSRQYTKNGKTAIIPPGYSIVSGVDDIDKGLVISDVENDFSYSSKGNQYVWVPVNSKDEWKLNTSYTGSYIPTESNTQSGELPDGITVDTIVEAGGFYIARYEAGKPDDFDAKTSVPLSMKDKEVWTLKDFGSSPEGVIESAQSIVSNEYVKSGLVTGIGWDVTMNWLANSGVRVSTWYGNSSGTAKVTGYDFYNRIYDLAGNYWDFTGESCNDWPYVVRGGSYAQKLGTPYRGWGGDVNTSVGADTCTFRTALFVIK